MWIFLDFKNGGGGGGERIVCCFTSRSHAAGSLYGRSSYCSCSGSCPPRAGCKVPGVVKVLEGGSYNYCSCSSVTVLYRNGPVLQLCRVGWGWGGLGRNQLARSVSRVTILPIWNTTYSSSIYLDLHLETQFGLVVGTCSLVDIGGGTKLGFGESSSKMYVMYSGSACYTGLKLWYDKRTSLSRVRKFYVGVVHGQVDTSIYRVVWT